jgi:cbb3-type cytochrome c oxidase subunit III
MAGRLAALPGLTAVLLVSAACGSEAHVTEGSTSRGKQLFTEKCASCHTLADAGAQGRIGPNLDEAFVNARDPNKLGQGIKESTIRDVVRGQIAYPVEDPVTGVPGMPPDLVTGEDADAVAAYVAAVAGLPVQGGGGGGGTQATDGKTIFTQNCGSCHTLAAAGTSGTIGPNLDEAKPSTELAIERVTNGMGAMPSFRGRLSEQQIRAVAEYVAQNAGK